MAELELLKLGDKNVVQPASERRRSQHNVTSLYYTDT